MAAHLSKSLKLKTSEFWIITKSAQEITKVFTKVSTATLLTLQTKMKLSVKDFFSKCNQIRRKPIWSYLWKKSLMKSFISCAVSNPTECRYNGGDGWEYSCYITRTLTGKIFIRENAEITKECIAYDTAIGTNNQ